MAGLLGQGSIVPIESFRGPTVADGDPDLRSAAEIMKYVVKSSDGELGHMHDLILEDANSFIRFLSAHTGSWFAGQKILLATCRVGSVSWSNREIVLPHANDFL